MSYIPPAVVGLEFHPATASIEISWQSLGLSPLIDHYRVHGRPGRHTSVPRDPSTLVGKSVYPRYVHTGLAPTGEEWTYQIVAISDAGRPGAASQPLVAHSRS